MPDNLQKKLRSAFTTPNAKGGLLIGPIGDFIDPGPSGGGASEPDDIQKTLRSARRKVMAELRQLFTPHMWESGFRIGPIGDSRPMKLWAPRDATEAPTAVLFKGFALTHFWGFSEDGIITDATAGGCVIESLSDFPLEDLLMLKTWATRNLPAAVATPA